MFDKTFDRAERIKDHLRDVRESDVSSRKPKSKMAQLAEKLRRRGFDKARVINGSVKVGCSQCEALAINGVACHEHGCPNEK